MSPKEKAKELIEMFNPFMYCFLGSGMLANEYDEDVALHNAKRASLITVSEILETVYGGYDYDREYEEPYWKEVETEIHNFKWE